MAQITLQPITRDNWRQCVRLSVSEAQKDFVASNVQSLAQAAYETNLTPLAAYDGEMMVGFTMYTHEPNDDGHFWIMRVLIDQAQQGKGYGRALMVQVIARMRTLPACTEIYLDYHKQNPHAKQLYASLGFVEVPEMEQEHEYVALLVL